MADGSDTIVALATGRGSAGVAVIRISGPCAFSLGETITGDPLPEPRVLARRRFQDAAGLVIDDGLMVCFPGPSSFTGENVVEIHGHGGHAVTSALIAALCADAQARLAEPGEFSKRAFIAGKMDLTQAEGLADLIVAETEVQRRQAIEQMGGALLSQYQGWRQDLIEVMAYLEATIDFSDQEIPDGLPATLNDRLVVLREAIEVHLDRAVLGERRRNGIFVSILGAPNTGKSSLLNRLAGREAAIVSETAGTTRDTIEVHLDLAGIPLILIDTAGLRETADDIEAEGVRRALTRADTADLILVVLDGLTWPIVDDTVSGLIGEKAIVAFNKIDEADPAALDAAAAQGYSMISAKTGAGLPDLEVALHARASALLQQSGDPPPTRERHRLGLRACLKALDTALAEDAVELKGESLRIAATELGRLTGQVGVEDILDVVFSQFCIGK